jgi:DNA helicase-2/ATP-dependent DNA helicase PcrA
MDLLSSLNPEQREAVLHVNGPLLILAGAGSGKTRVIAHRIAHLVSEEHCRPDELVAVTFTNKAAEEMRSRVEALLHTNCRGMWISTFHALCARLLRREAHHLGLPRDFVIYDSTDQLSVVKRALRELGLDDSSVQPRAILSRISHAKNRMESPDDVAGKSWSAQDDALAKVYAAYSTELRDAHALDFDDLLLQTVELFERCEAVRTRYSEHFRFVLVDEYQDTNRPQYLLIRRLTSRHRNLCVVGDPDQSIYKWRGADLRNILDFEHDFPETQTVRLERNYRSTQVILDAASAVISQNRHRKEKRLYTDRTGGEKIRYYRASDDLDEAEFIGRTARDAIRLSPDDAVAVLYRTNAQSRTLEDALRRMGISYRIIGGVRFYERKEIKDALAYLRLAVNPHDDVSLRRVINVPSRGIGKGVLDTLEAVEIDASSEAPLLVGLSTDVTEHSLWARLTEAVDRRALAGRALAALTGFRDIMLDIREAASGESVATAVAKTLDRSGYLADLRQERSEEAEGRIENLAELVSAAREYELRSPEPSLSGFVDQLSLLSDVDEESGASDAHVLMMTMHSAKGLEFPVVVIAGLDEGLFPHSRATDDETELEEERRLCYVGMTRAERRLILTSAMRRRLFGEYQATEPSRFVDEVPRELVDDVSADAVNASRIGFGRSGLSSAMNTRSRWARAQESEPTYSYADEDQSAVSGLRPGVRVRHAQFGVGTVLSVEQLEDDSKLIVRFVSVGQKTLRAKYAKLDLVG